MKGNQMPNWCDNEVEFTGKNLKDLKEFMGTGEEPMSFDHMKPRPLDIGDDWYEWSITNWGTKWDITGGYYDEDDMDTDYTRLSMSFETAWGPPEEIYNLIIEFIDKNKLDIDVNWFYKEPLMQIAGWLGVNHPLRQG
jgi:hypothetical protein